MSKPLAHEVAQKLPAKVKWFVFFEVWQHCYYNSKQRNLDGRNQNRITCTEASTFWGKDKCNWGSSENRTAASTMIRLLEEIDKETSQ